MPAKTNAETLTLSPAAITLLTPPKRTTPSEWAASEFFITEKGAVRPGPYDIEWTPWWREPLDCVGDPTVRRINIVAAAQTGKTQMMNAGVAYLARFSPANLLYVRPGESDVGEAFRDRFEPMIRGNLRDLLPRTGEWMTTSRNPAINLSSMMIYGAAATVPRQMTSRTCAVVWYDETDSGGDSGNELGNVLDVIEERQMAFSATRAQTIGTSTPKYESGSNWLAFDRSSDRREYYTPCPFCGGYFLLTMKHLVTLENTKDAGAIRQERLARARCDYCGELIDDTWQPWMSDRGVWVADGQRVVEALPEDEDIRARARTLEPAASRWRPQLEGESPRPWHRGYRVWRGQTKFEQCSWSNILARWFEVSASRDPERLQVFINNWLAEPWKEAVAPADEDTLRARIGVYEPRVIPDRARVVLGFVDVQSDSIWYLFRAFGPNQESWLIQYGTMEVTGDDYPSTFDALYEMAMRRGWPVKGEDNLRMRAYAIAVDSGYRPDEVYEFARQPGVIPTKGHDIADYRIRANEVEGKKRPDPLRLWHVNTKVFKDRLQRLIKQPDDADGGWHLHAETTGEYVQHLTAEHLKGRRSNPKIKTWQPITDGRPNHLLDCEAGVLALAEALEQRAELSLMAMVATDPRVGAFRSDGHPIGAAPKPAPKKRRPRKRSDWLDGAGGW